MSGDSADPLSPKRILIVMIIALIIVFAGTIMLNGSTSTEIEENNTTEEQVNETANVTTVNTTLIGNNSWGSVNKMGTFGNTSSNIRIAFIIGVNQEDISNNSIVPNFENQKDLHYAYDIYMINVTNNNNNNTTSDNSTDLSVKNKTQLLAKEYAVPDIISKKYNCTVDVHSTNDSNSYVFVPSDETVTSEYLVDQISSTTSVGRYTPEVASYTNYVSKPLLSSNIASIVYVTRDFKSTTLSNEVNEIIHAIDAFNFEDVSVYKNTDDSSDSSSSSQSTEETDSSSSGDSSSNSSSSNSAGNSEVD